MKKTDSAFFKRLVKPGFVTKLVGYYSLILLVLISLLFGLAYVYVINVSGQNAQISQQQLLEKTASQLEMCFSDMSQVAQQVNKDSGIITIFKELQSDEKKDNYFGRNIMEGIEYQSALQSMVGPSSRIWRISIYNEYGDILSTDSSMMQNSTDEMLDSSRIVRIKHQLMNGKQGEVVLAPQQNRWAGTSGVEYISLISLLTDYSGDEVYGIIEVHQTIEKVKSYLTFDVMSDTETFLSDNYGGQIYLSEKDYSSLSEQNYYISERSTTYGWNVALAQDKEQYMMPYRMILFYLFIAGIAIMLFLFLMIFLITRSISKPLVALTKTVREISLETLSDEIKSDGTNDEIKDLAAAFSSMLQKLNDSISLEQRAYLMALQSQMDPHFLYNSLAILSSIGIEHGDDEIVLFCDKLGSMLRYSTSYETKVITLKDELENAQNYLDLMKLRYEDYFVYSMDIDDCLLDKPISRLTVQPLLENCFEHGFKGVQPPWNICVTGRISIEDGSWFVSVKDNGIGISDEKKAEMNEKIEEYSRDIQGSYNEMKIGGMGLINTIIRLNLTSNGRVVCTVRDNAPAGTEVLLEGKM